MSEKIRINVTVGGKRYPFNILRKDEEVFRKAAKMVDGRYAKFLQETNLDPTDCFAVIAIESYVKNMKEAEGATTEKFNQSIEEIFELLQKAEEDSAERKLQEYNRNNGLLF